MTTVFIGGSRHVSRLNDIIRSRLNNIVENRLDVVIGDANGVDRAVQAYLSKKGYEDVVVYCMTRNCRNNVGGWPLCEVQGQGKRGFDYYALKDEEMAKVADCGLMIWDGKSRGTLSNIKRLIEESKPVLVYVSPERRCHTIRNRSEFNNLFTRASTKKDKYLIATSNRPQTDLFFMDHND